MLLEKKGIMRKPFQRILLLNLKQNVLIALNLYFLLKHAVGYHSYVTKKIKLPFIKNKNFLYL